MSKVSCEICMDLIPLIKDGVASKDSEQLVKEHVENCPTCAEYFEPTPTPLPAHKYDLILTQLKTYTYMLSAVLIGIGIIVGTNFHSNFSRYYNVVLMLLVGFISFFFFKKKSYIVLIVIFAFSFIQHFSVYVIGSGALSSPVPLSHGLYFSIIFPSFSVLVCLIGISLAYIIKRILSLKLIKK